MTRARRMAECFSCSVLKSAAEASTMKACLADSFSDHIDTTRFYPISESEQLCFSLARLMGRGRKSIPPWCNCQKWPNQVGTHARVRLQGRRHEKGERSVGALRVLSNR